MAFPQKHLIGRSDYITLDGAVDRLTFEAYIQETETELTLRPSETLNKMEFYNGDDECGYIDVLPTKSDSVYGKGVLTCDNMTRAIMVFFDTKGNDIRAVIYWVPEYDSRYETKKEVYDHPF